MWEVFDTRTGKAIMWTRYEHVAIAWARGFYDYEWVWLRPFDPKCQDCRMGTHGK